MKSNPKLKCNAHGHTINNTKKTIDYLAYMLFSNNKTPSHKIKEIVTQILEPEQVDVLVTGLYIDSGDTISIKLVVVAKHLQKSYGKLLNFPKEKYTCDTKQHSLCLETREVISQEVQELLEML